MAFCWMSMALESPWTANFLVAGLLTTFVPMAAARPDKAMSYAFIATVTSVLGGIFGWVLGYYAFDLIARPVLEFYGKLGAFEEMRTTVEFCAQLSCGGAVGPYEGMPFDGRSLRISVGVRDDARKLPETVRRALRAMEELKPLGNRCDMLHVSHGHIRPVAPLPEDVEGERWRPGCYAEIGGADD